MEVPDLVFPAQGTVFWSITWCEDHYDRLRRLNMAAFHITLLRCSSLASTELCTRNACWVGVTFGMEHSEFAMRVPLVFIFLNIAQDRSMVQDAFDDVQSYVERVAS
jgi:hypothetical protein